MLGVLRLLQRPADAVAGRRPVRDQPRRPAARPRPRPRLADPRLPHRPQGGKGRASSARPVAGAVTGAVAAGVSRCAGPRPHRPERTVTGATSRTHGFTGPAPALLSWMTRWTGEGETVDARRRTITDARALRGAATPAAMQSLAASPSRSPPRPASPRATCCYSERPRSAASAAARRRSGSGPDRRQDRRRRPRSTRPSATRLIALVELARGGDTEAFGLLYDHYNATVYRFLYYRVGSQMLAEDLTRETFFRALRSMDNFRWQGKDFGAWLMTIARNLATDHFKAGRTRLEMTTEDMTPHDDTDRGARGRRYSPA